MSASPDNTPLPNFLKAPLTSGEAHPLVCKVAGIPPEDVCIWVLTVARHTDRGHEPVITTYSTDPFSDGSLNAYAELTECTTKTLRKLADPGVPDFPPDNLMVE